MCWPLGLSVLASGKRELPRATLKERRILRRASSCSGSCPMLTALVRRVCRLGCRLVQAARLSSTEAATKPSSARLVVDTLADLPRSKAR